MSQTDAPESKGQVSQNTEEQNVSPGQRFRPRTIGIYGPRRAGKTCYLATAFLGLSSSAECRSTVILADEHSRNLLQGHWDALHAGQVPPATEAALSYIRGSLVVEPAEGAESAKVAERAEVADSAEVVKPAEASIAPGKAADSSPPSRQPEVTEQRRDPHALSDCGIVWAETEVPEEQQASHPASPPSSGNPSPQRTFRVPKRRLVFSTADFGGRLCERGDAGLPAITEEFRQWLEGADCLLFFLPVEQLRDPQEARERLLEVDAVLSRLLERSPTGQAVGQPIAVLVTKWDLESDLTGTPEEEYQKLRSFLTSRAGDVAKGVCDKIEQAGEKVRLFPVSAFGGA